MVEQELLNLGLSTKEAEVYLATLQIGYATVQKIAQKAEINRTTTYTHIKNLITRGLISSLNKNGKQFFVAEKPNKLKYYFDQQEKEIQRRKQSLEKIMPELESLYSVDSDRPSVRFYGDKNLSFLRQEILNSRADEIFSVFNYEHFKDTIDKAYITSLLDSTLKFKKLFIATHKVLDRRLQPFIKHDRFEVKYLPFSKFNCLCELVIGDKEVFIARQTDSLIIKDSLFSQTLKILFTAMWGLAEYFD